MVMKSSTQMKICALRPRTPTALTLKYACSGCGELYKNGGALAVALRQAHPQLQHVGRRGAECHEVAGVGDELDKVETAGEVPLAEKRALGKVLQR
jgi:hypothetical protein